jgi:hypothetical protein
MGRQWIAFANWKEPWELYLPDQGAKLAICEDLVGWETRTRDNDMKINHSRSFLGPEELSWVASHSRGFRAA